MFKNKKKLLFYSVSALVSVFVSGTLAFILSLNAYTPTVSDAADSCARYLMSFGWEVSDEPFEVVYMKLPESFNDVYTRYNELQLAQGFDLTAYRGKQVEKRVYSVYNYPGAENDETIRANVFVSGKKIIGADICTTRADGFMHGVNEYGDGKNKD